MNTNPRLRFNLGGNSPTTRAFLRRGPRALCLVLSLQLCLGCKHESTVSYGPTNDAEEAFARPDKPANAKTLFAFARLLLSQGKTAEGEYVLQQLLRTSPQFRPAYLKLGELQMRSGRVDAAVATLTTGLAIAPDDPVLLNDLGMCWMLKDRHDLALSLFDQASAGNSKDGRYIVNGAIALGMMGRYQESLDRFARVLSEKDAHRNVGVICVARGDYDAASTYIQSAWQDKPDVSESGSAGPAEAEPYVAPVVPEASTDELKVAEPKSRKVGSVGADADEATVLTTEAPTETSPSVEVASAAPTSAPADTAPSPAPVIVEPVPVAASVSESAAQVDSAEPSPATEVAQTTAETPPDSNSTSIGVVIPVSNDEPSPGPVEPPAQVSPTSNGMPAAGAAALPPAIKSESSATIPVSVRPANPGQRSIGWAFGNMEDADRISAVEVTDPMPRSLRARSAARTDRRLSGHHIPAGPDKGTGHSRPRPVRGAPPRSTKGGGRAEIGASAEQVTALPPNEVHQVAILRGHEQKTVVFRGGTQEEPVNTAATEEQLIDDSTSGPRVIQLKTDAEVDTIIFDTKGRQIPGSSHVRVWVAE